MVKVTSSLLVGAALFASSSTLAAPTPFKRSNAEVSASADIVDGSALDESELVDEVAGALGVDQQTGAAGQIIADNLRKRDAKRTGADAIRRGIALAPNTAEDLVKRESVVAKLGLTGALAPLGVGPLIPTVQGLVDGLPVVGGPVGGLVKTVDSTVGLTDLLNKPKVKRQILDGLLGGNSPVGGLTSSLPLGGTINTGTSTINGLLGQLQSAGASSSQLAGVLGQLQGLGLGNLPLSALTGSATSTATSAASSAANAATASAPSTQSAQQAASILQGLTVAQAEQYGLLPSGTTGRLLNQIESAAEAQASQNNLASSFTSRVNGFKAQAGANETMEGSPETDDGGATPTFPIASPDAVASAINAGGSANSTETGTPTASSDMAKRTMMPSPSSVSSSAPTASASSTSTMESMEDSGSDYSDEEEEDDDEDESDFETETDGPATPASSADAPLSKRGGASDEDMSMEGSEKHHGGMEGQGPNASGASSAWHATESSSMAQTQSQAVATAEAMSFTYSDASATAVPTTAPSKRGYAELD
ncbi:hypothetical protein JCM10212_003210 [Sporobolomyces blumeae]